MEMLNLILYSALALLLIVLGILGIIKVIDPGAFDHCARKSLIVNAAKGGAPGTYDVYANSRSETYCGTVTIKEVR